MSKSCLCSVLANLEIIDFSIYILYYDKVFAVRHLTPSIWNGAVVTHAIYPASSGVFLRCCTGAVDPLQPDGRFGERNQRLHQDGGEQPPEQPGIRRPERQADHHH